MNQIPVCTGGLPGAGGLLDCPAPRAANGGGRRNLVSATILDTKGLRCPLPVLRARKAMKALAPGEVIEIHATDPGSVQDFQSFCKTTGHELVNAAETDGVFIFEIRKAG
jgi:tRNA 2-thiouridine synthesizing protein A